MSSAVEKFALSKACLLALAGALLALAGCSSGPRADIPYAPTGFDVRPDVVFQNQQHRIGPSDVVTVTVYRVPEVSGDYRVDGNGGIVMPLVGATQVQGMTTTELAAALRQSLASKYYVNPDVSVALKESSLQQVTIDGSVQAPGLYPLQGQTTLMRAVALARGATPNANLRRVVVFRQIQGQRMVAAFDLRAIREGQMADPDIFPSDIVVVDGNETRQTLRDIISTIPILALFRPLIL